MSKKKAGIFDPWRQETEPLEEVPEPMRVNVDPESMSAGATQPVRFAGKRAGLSVWIAHDNPEQAADQAQTNVLAALIELMTDEKLVGIFTKWGIGGDELVGGSAAHTVMSDGVRTVVAPGDYTKALDAVALALREAVRVKPKTNDYLLSLGIRPYII